MTHDFEACIAFSLFSSSFFSFFFSLINLRADVFIQVLTQNLLTLASSAPSIS